MRKAKKKVEYPLSPQGNGAADGLIMKRNLVYYRSYYAEMEVDNLWIIHLFLFYDGGALLLAI